MVMPMLVGLSNDCRGCPGSHRSSSCADDSLDCGGGDSCGCGNWRARHWIEWEMVHGLGVDYGLQVRLDKL